MKTFKEFMKSIEKPKPGGYPHGGAVPAGRGWMNAFKDLMKKRNDKRWEESGDRKVLVKAVWDSFEKSIWKKDGWELSHIENPKYFDKKGYVGNINVTIMKGDEEKVIRM